MVAVQVSWFEKTPYLIHLEFPDLWESEDFDRAKDEIRAMIATSNHRIDLLIDLRSNTRIPNNALVMFNSLFSLNSARTGMLLFITHTAFQRSMVHIIQRTNAPLKRPVFLISTPDEIATLRAKSAKDS